MMASGEIRLLPTTMRRMPVLAQSQDSASIPQASGPADYQIDTPITVTSQSTAPTSFNAWSAFLNGFTFSNPSPPKNYPYTYGVFLPPLGGVARASTLAAGNGSGVTVLGSYPDYVNLAEQLGANYFNVPMEQWAQMTADEQWAANQAFIDSAVARGDSFVFSNEFAVAGSSYQRELLYLELIGVALGAN